MSSQILEYGLLPPTKNADLVRDQMRLGHQYRNVLIEIERDRRTRVREALSTHPDVDQVEQQINQLVVKLDQARDAISLTRAAARARGESAAQREVARDLRAQIKLLRAQAREARSRIAADPEIAARIEEANEAAAEKTRIARAASGLYWGTYLINESAMAAARTSITPPEFVPWRGEGRASVQLQGGIDASELHGVDTQIQIVSCPPRPGIRRRLGRSSILRIRVQSDERKKPIWAEFVMIEHRPVPKMARVKIATVSLRRRGGTSWAWRLHLTVDVSACASPTRASATPNEARQTAVALNLGFARRPDGGLRSGYLVGIDGMEKEVLAQKSDAHRPARTGSSQLHHPSGATRPSASRWTQDSLEKADAIRSQRDRDLDAMRATLCAWKAANEDILPEWFAEKTQHLGAWRSAARFAALTFRWREGWFEGGDDGYDLIERWRLRDLHLERYETGMRKSTILDRREGYRILAARMADRYQELVVDNTDLRALRRSPKPEDDAEIDAVKHQQVMAAPGELRQAMMNAFGPTRVVKLSAVNVTRRCHACGHVRDRGRGDEAREQTCPGCKITCDQDANACRNLLREHRETTPDREAARAAKPAKKQLTRAERMMAGKIAARERKAARAA